MIITNGKTNSQALGIERTLRLMCDVRLLAQHVHFTFIKFWKPNGRLQLKIKENK